MVRCRVGMPCRLTRRAADGAKDRAHDVRECALTDPALGEVLRGLPADGRHDARGQFDR